MQLALSKNAASLPYGKHRFIVCTFSLRCKSTQIHQSATFDSQSALADKINRFLTEQADRLDKVCGWWIYRNDNCFVEQKNESVVRRIVGYYRFEGEAARMVMADLYEQYNTLVNFFFPSMKIISKQRVEAKVIKKYDTAKTPYCRLMESSDVSEAVKAELCRRKNSLDLQQLLEETHTLQSKLISMAQPCS